MYTKKTIQRNPEVMWREEEETLADVSRKLVQGEDVSDIGVAVLFSGGALLSINCLGMEIWKQCHNRTVDEIVAELLQQYDVEEELLRQDVQAFLDELARKGFIAYV